MLSTENGREKIRAAAKILNNTVTNRLNTLSEAALFYFHLSNACYKQYCYKKSLLKFQSDKEKTEYEDEANKLQSTEEQNLRKSARKRARHHSPQASVSSYLDHLCIICNQKSHKKIYQK